jgi:hypothetical protein
MSVGHVICCRDLTTHNPFQSFPIIIPMYAFYLVKMIGTVFQSAILLGYFIATLLSIFPAACCLKIIPTTGNPRL